MPTRNKFAVHIKIQPKTGKILINDNDVTNLPVYLRAREFKVGYVPQYGGYFNDLTVINNLNAISEIVSDDKNFMKNKIEYLANKFELENKLMGVSTLSSHEETHRTD